MSRDEYEGEGLGYDPADFNIEDGYAGNMAREKQNPIFVQQRAERAARARAAEERAKTPEERARPMNERLRNTYGIEPAMPQRKKVEVLREHFLLDPDEIATELKLTVEVVNRDIERLEQEIEEIGRVRTPEEKKRERSIYIRNMERARDSIQRQFEVSREEKLVPHLVRLNDTLLRLKDIDKDAIAEAEEDGPGFSNVLEAAIAELRVDQIAELRAFLR